MRVLGLGILCFFLKARKASKQVEDFVVHYFIDDEEEEDDEKTLPTRKQTIKGYSNDCPI
jgi:hypothetical protein